ncbi:MULTISPECIES: cytochrome P450 [unclassified Novosphingobium]|uniref:cytochrome P450 n=1 Tax=unclassified Novosphingobium TaxID=2644732 RepID=UPI000D2F7EA8|nr:MULTISPECIES: cytochrome P450 [unclassified Novosphingobium]PTR07712.1 cytochrome P450 [Novosphingobium sp. GV055]PUB00398.1 cytochrome P450 [Novosphingobium sp. GV061]PUB15737.1 cytochrome P450 [Novosphingobium sp. GV079]PUB39424.1 cytochrome P450 [Novosphingobium sp. GV027]
MSAQPLQGDVTRRSISDLADLPHPFEAGFSEDFAALFGTAERLFKAGSKRIVVFRGEDLRRIAALPAVGNMPLRALAERAMEEAGDDRAEHDQPDVSNFGRILFNQVFTANPPLHGPTRQLLAKPFGMKQVAAFDDLVRGVVDKVLAEVAGAGEIDFGFDFTEQVTAGFWGALIGLTPSEQRQVVEQVRAMTSFFFLVRTAAETVEANAAIGAYLSLMATAIERTLAEGNNPLLATMAAEFDAVTIEGKPESVALSLAANLIDGFHTAALAAANATYQLLRHPAAAAEVRADPQRVGAAIDEGLRMSSPVIVTHRYALEDFVFDDVLVPAGTAIAMLWAAGNRDPDIFDDPGTYRLERMRRYDATFGGGIHLCPGRNIARLMVHRMLARLFAPDVRIELAGPVEWITQSTMRQPYRMPARIDMVPG